MSHFSTVARIKYKDDINAVLMAIRSSDSHVEEYLIPAPDAVSFCIGEEEGWFGEGSLKGKIKATHSILCIEVGYNKRSLYSFSISNFTVFRAQLRSLLREAQQDGARLVLSQVDHVRLTSDPSFFDYDKIAGHVASRLGPLIQTMLRNVPEPVVIREGQTSPIERSSRTTSPPIKTDVFIPNDILDSKIEGKVNVQQKQTKSDVSEAAKALRDALRRKKNAK